jgi:5'-3' exoribonuclease 2
MGVPAFFRWLSQACPKVVRVAEEYPGVVDPQCDPDYNNPIIDCLYLDMNGIIHPCSHPTSDTVAPS